MLDTLSGIATGLRNFSESLGNFTAGLNDNNTWLRVVFVLVGIILILAVLLKATSGRV